MKFPKKVEEVIRKYCEGILIPVAYELQLDMKIADYDVYLSAMLDRLRVKSDEKEDIGNA